MSRDLRIPKDCPSVLPVIGTVAVCPVCGILVGVDNSQPVGVAIHPPAQGIGVRPLCYGHFYNHTGNCIRFSCPSRRKCEEININMGKVEIVHQKVKGE